MIKMALSPPKGTAWVLVAAQPYIILYSAWNVWMNFNNVTRRAAIEMFWKEICGIS
jgi:hypothetical protein